MKKSRTKILLSVAVFLLAFIMTACGSTDYTVTVVNDFGYVIYELYITPDTSDEWGDSMISGRLRDGATADITLKNAKDVKSYDLFFIDEDDDEYEFYGLVLADGDEVDILWDDGIYVLITAKDGKTMRVDVYYDDSYDYGAYYNDSYDSGEYYDYYDDELKVAVQNNLHSKLNSLCVAPVGQAWSANYLEARALETLSYTNLDLFDYAGNSDFDIWLVDVGGNNYGFYGVTLSNGVSTELIWVGEAPELRISYNDGTTEKYTGKYTPANPTAVIAASASTLPPVAVDQVEVPMVRTSGGGTVKHSDPGDSGYYYGLYGYYDPWGNYYYYAFDDYGYYDSYGNYYYYDSDPGDLGYSYGEYGYFDPWGNYYLYDDGYSYDYYDYYYGYYSDYYYYDDYYYDDGYYYYHDGYYDYYDDWDSYYYDYYDDYYYDYDPWSDPGDYYDYGYGDYFEDGYGDYFEDGYGDYFEDGYGDYFDDDYYYDDYEYNDYDW